jgi:hypothetical protein
MKAWFPLTLVGWALVCLLLSLSQQAGLNYLSHLACSRPWLDQCAEPTFGSPTAAVVRSMEFDRARAGPLQFLALGCALTAGNIGPPPQETHGPPELRGPGRVGGGSKQAARSKPSSDLISTKFPAFNSAN